MFGRCTIAVLSALLLVNILVEAQAAEPATRPNVLFILCDDLGYGDLGCYGHPTIRTPNLDRLAAEGMRLTAYYSASAVCSPSRAGLLTGRTPCRLGIHCHIPWGSPMHLRRGEITLAELLHAAGYATCQVGKWHLNGRFNDPAQPQPSDHGFDYWFATQNNALPNHCNPDNFVRNAQPVGPLAGYSSALIVDEAIHWLDQVRPRAKPFFLYVAFHAPHEPIATPADLIRAYPSPDDPKRAVYYGNVTHMDRELGRLLDKLEREKLRDNTFVFFSSDNGPAYQVPYPYGSAGKLRQKKGHVYEGGIRVPGIFRWPGRVPAGSVCDEPVCGVDLLPTVCALVGVQVPQDRAIDGADVSPLFAGRPVGRTVPLYWQYNQASSPPKVAARLGDWKILATLTAAPKKPSQHITAESMRDFKAAELAHFELYNVRTDPDETTDVAATQPERLRQMRAALDKMYRAVRDESPVWPAWEAPPYERDRIRWFKLDDAPAAKSKQ